MPEEPIEESVPEPQFEVMLPPPPPKPQRSLLGWAISCILLFLAAWGALDYYFGQETSTEPSYAALQDSFRQRVSFASTDLSALGSSSEKLFPSGLQDIIDPAIESAPQSDEAARIAIVAAYEEGIDPEPIAVARLWSSQDPVSLEIAQLYTGEFVTWEFVEEFRSRQTNEFAVGLAQVHASEMLGEDGGREQFIDSSLFFKVIVIMAGVLVAGAGGVLCLIMFFVMRANGKLVAVGFPKFAKSDGDRYMMRFAAYMIAFQGFSFLAIMAIDKGYFTIDSSWIHVIALTMVLVAVVAFFYVATLGKADSIREVFGKKVGFFKAVGLGAFGYLCTVPIFMTVLFAVSALSKYLPAPSHPISEQMTNAVGPAWIPIILAAVVLAPIVEEITFRGLLFPALFTQFKRPLWAILACGFIFAIIHPQGPLIWPALMATGGAAACLRYYTGSIYPSIVLHVLHNGAILTLGLLMA